MDIIVAARDSSPAANNVGCKSPELGLKRFISIHNAKPLSFTNGVLKRHPEVVNPNPPAEGAVMYKECLKNHAATLGGHALDGCGEFMHSPNTRPDLPTSLKCAVCGCHRNFHRRQPEDSTPNLKLLTPPPLSSRVVECQPQHRHRPPQPLASVPASSPNPSSPPPISSSFYPSSAPHMLLALSTGFENSPQAGLGAVAVGSNQVSGRKRFRTKFSNAQKENMYEFAERIGWRLDKKEAELVNQFCKDIGVEKGIFKVWMHNNKSTVLRKRSFSANSCGFSGNGFLHRAINHHHHQHQDINNCEVNTHQQKHQHNLHSLVNHSNMNVMNVDDGNMIQHHDNHHHSDGSSGNVTTNGSSSSS